jgi:hypothetical protein
MSQMPDLNDLLKRWPSLPDDAVVHTKVVAAVTGLSERTIRYDSRFERVYLTPNRYGFRVGSVKNILSGGWQPIGAAAQRVVESCGGADIRDTNIRLQRELNQQERGEKS